MDYSIRFYFVRTLGRDPRSIGAGMAGDFFHREN